MTSRVTVWLTWGMLAVIAMPVPRTLLAQVDPRGAMRTVTTKHLQVHVKRGQEDLGQRVADIGEQAWQQLAAELVPPRGRIDILVADNTDVSNGFAQSFPTNRVVIYAVPPIGSTELRFHDDWLQLVVTHEMAHIFHLDRARGVWRAGRWVFGRNSALFPAAFTPGWVKEGLAVHYETLLTGSGRLTSTESRTVARTAARDHELPSTQRWSRTTSQFPKGQIPYAYGALLMNRSASVGGDSSMRQFVEGTAKFPIPFLLDRASRNAFGTAFSEQFNDVRDSLRTLVSSMDTTGDGVWTTISTAGWHAESPRWHTGDTIMWVANDGRDITGVYVADVSGSMATRDASRTALPAVPVAQRVARRNNLDVNVPGSGDTTIFAQLDLQNPYELRSDLYRGVGEKEERLTHGARLTQPDVRGDGSVVAIQLAAGRTYLVRVSQTGNVNRLSHVNTWAEPRWSPDGTRIAAVEFLPTGEERIVVMDTLGRVLTIVAGGRAVFSSPSFTPAGDRLVWASDRSGIMQLETARMTAMSDTVSWREENRTVHVASAVTTGVYQPSVSPDGRWVAALRYRGDGFHVAIAPLDTAGPIARSTWYPAINPRSSVPSVLGTASALSGSSAARAANAVNTINANADFHRYQPLRQLIPRYWLPQLGTGRTGETSVGASSSSSDILGRHEWSAQAFSSLETHEVDASAAYRYRGLGVPVLDVSWSQSWDATFRVADTTNGANATLGFVARRRRFASVSGTWSVPRTRRSVSATVGAQYELRDFSSAVDSLLGDATSVLRTGTRYPSAFVNTSMSTARIGARSISVEEGLSIGTSSSYRWREDMPSLGSWRHIASARGYFPLNLPGFARHVMMVRVSGGVADNNAQTEFNVGGVSGERVEVIPGVVIGDPGRTFAVRGVSPGVQRGTRALGGSVEYRAPLLMVRHAPSPFTVFFDRVSFTAFTDAGRAWCPAALVDRQSALCNVPANVSRVGALDGWIASAGAEIVIDLAVQYDTPYRLRFGGAAPYLSPRSVPKGGALYVTLGSYF